MLLCYAMLGGRQPAVAWIKLSVAQRNRLFLQTQFIFRRRQFQARRFEILLRDAALFVQRAATLVDGAGIVNLRARIEQRFPVLSIGLGDGAGDETSFAG